MGRTDQLIKIAKGLYEANMLSEAKSILGVKSTNKFLKIIQGDLLASGEPIGKIATQVSNYVSQTDPVQKLFKQLVQRKAFGWYGGNPDHIPIPGRAIVSPHKPTVNYSYANTWFFKRTRSWVSPHNPGERLYGAQNNPVTEGMDAWSMGIANTAKDKTWQFDVIGGSKLPHGRASVIPRTGSLTEASRRKPHKPISDMIAPVFEKHFGEYSSWLRKNVQTFAIARGIKNIKGKKTVELFEAAKKTSGKTATESLKKLSKGEHPLQAKFEKIKLDRDELEKVWRPPYERVMGQLAEKFPDSRTFLVNDSTWYGTKTGLLSKVKSSMSPQELKASERVRNYMKIRGGQLRKAEIKVLGLNDPDFLYMPHVIKKHLIPATTKTFQDKFAAMPELLEFRTRLPGSVPWFPSTRAALDWYIPTVNKRLAFAPFQRKWKDHVDKLGSRDVRGSVRAWWGNWFDRNMNFDENTAFHRLVNLYVNAEYVRLIGLSPSVGFKHLLKVSGTMQEHGVGASISGAKEAMKYGRQALTQTKTSPYLKESKHLAQWFIANRYVKAKVLYQSLAEMPGMRGMGENLRKWTGFPTTWIEFMDRGINVYATIAAGAKRGADFHQIHSRIHGTILDVNFLGAFDQFRWQQGPALRAGTMFLMTPIKIFEHKHKIFMKAIRGEKDIFGEHYGYKLARMFATIGMAEAIARYHDASVWEFMIHPPFLYSDYRYGGHKIYEPPIVDHWEKISNRGFVDGMAESFGYFGLFEKIRRVKDGEIPAQYDDNELRYLLTLPKKTLEKELQSGRRVRRDVKERKYKARKDKNPLERGVEIIEDMIYD